MQTIKGMPAAAAWRTASGAAFGGTTTKLALAPVFCTASSTVS